MIVQNMRRIDAGGLLAEFEVYLEFNNLPLFVIPGWKLLRKKADGQRMIMTPRTLYTDYKTKAQKEGSIFKGRLNPKIEEIILNLANQAYDGNNQPSEAEDIPF